VSRSSDETAQETWERAGWEKRLLLRRLGAIVQGQMGAARVLRDKAMRATLGGWDPAPWMHGAEQREAQAHEAARALVKARNGSP
jgi:hypothetical protein